MFKPQLINTDAGRMVVLREEDYLSLCAEARVDPEAVTLPAYPPARADGTMPALDAIRVSIARDIIAARQRAGLTQQELAKRAGVRQETISRLESAKHSISDQTFDRIWAALGDTGGARGPSRKTGGTKPAKRSARRRRVG